MNKSIYAIAILLSIFSVALTSCNKDDSDDEQDLKKSSLKLTLEGVTSTEVVGEISVCSDGFFTINGKTPDGTPIAMSTSKILVNETRSICTINQDYDAFIECVDNGGFNFGGSAFNQFYSPVSGTAKRTSTNSIEISGVLMKSDLSEHAFTLEATASLVLSINCE